MSYITPKISTENMPFWGSELDEAVTEAALKLFAEKDDFLRHYPPALRPGPETVKLIRELFSASVLWFNAKDKVRYLLESGSIRPYRDFWGLLSKIWSRQRAKIASDLLLASQKKLRALLFMELARSTESTHLLTNYFNRYLTERWSNGGKSLLARSRFILFANPIFNRANEIISESSTELLNQAESELNLLINIDDTRLAPKLIINAHNKIYMAAFWNPQATARRLGQMETSWGLFDNNPGLSFKNRTLLRMKYLVAGKGWLEERVKNLVEYFEDIESGKLYSVYTALRSSNQLSAKTFFSIILPYQSEAAWNQKAVNAVLDEGVRNIHEKWFWGGLLGSIEHSFHKTINILRVMVYLRSHPKTGEILRWEGVKPKLNAIIKNFWKGGKNDEKNSRVSSIPYSSQIYHWTRKFESFVNNGRW